MAILKPSRLLVFITALSVCAFASAQRQNYSYALVTRNGESMMSNWSFNSDDTHFQKAGPDRLYTKRDGKLYVIYDAATLAEMRKAVEPMQEIGRKQSALGEKQSRLGEIQSRIGEKQSKLGEQMGRLGEEMGKLSEKYAGHENQDNEYEARQQDLQSKMDVLQRQMDALQKEMEKPSRQQDALGRQQDALGRQQQRAQDIAEPKIERIIDAAFARGLAKPA